MMVSVAVVILLQGIVKVSMNLPQS